MSFEPTHVYRSKRTRPEWFGRKCELVNTWRGHAPHNVRIRFRSGKMAVVPHGCIRRIKP